MLIGYTADEPQIRNFPNSKVANITVVTNESQKNNETGVYESVPEWHRVSLWYRNADVVEQYVHKGTQVYIEGKIRTRSYTDKTGVKRYSTEIVGDQIILLSSRRDPAPTPTWGQVPQVDIGFPPGNLSGSQIPPYSGTNIGSTNVSTPFPPTSNINNGGMTGGMTDGMTGGVSGGVSGSYVSHVPQDPYGNGSNNALDPNKSPWNQQANQFNTNSMNNANSFAGSSSTSAMPEMASGGFDQGAVPVSASVPAPAPEPAPIPAQTPTFEQGGGDEDIPF